MLHPLPYPLWGAAVTGVVRLVDVVAAVVRNRRNSAPRNVAGDHSKRWSVCR
jgi:hypothetical protein